jgi:hypothetical protein
MKIYFPLKVEGMFRHFSFISFSTICANHFPGNMYNSSEERKRGCPESQNPLKTKHHKH